MCPLAPWPPPQPVPCQLSAFPPLLFWLPVHRPVPCIHHEEFVYLQLRLQVIKCIDELLITAPMLVYEILCRPAPLLPRGRLFPRRLLPLLDCQIVHRAATLLLIEEFSCYRFSQEKDSTKLLQLLRNEAIFKKIYLRKREKFTFNKLRWRHKNPKNTLGSRSYNQNTRASHHPRMRITHIAENVWFPRKVRKLLINLFINIITVISRLLKEER